MKRGERKEIVGIDCNTLKQQSSVVSLARKNTHRRQRRKRRHHRLHPPTHFIVAIIKN